MERKAHSKIPLVRGNAGTNQGMRPVDKNIHSLHRSIVGTRRRRRNGVAHTLRVSEKRRPSCNEDMSSVMWEETDDGDIATASMGGSGDRRLPCCQYSPTSLLPPGELGAAAKPGSPLLGNQNPPKKAAGSFPIESAPAVDGRRRWWWGGSPLTYITGGAGEGGLSNHNQGL
jgi:hypothetical protein